jgi:hypothetical protein
MVLSYKRLVILVASMIVCFSVTQAGEAEHIRYRGVYLGQTRPGYKPEPFVEELFSAWGDYGFHLNSCIRFSPDMSELVFSSQTQPVVPGRSASIWCMKERNGAWTEPKVAVFSSGYDDAGAFYSSTGDTLYFHSLRPPNEKGASQNADIWYATKDGDDWLAPLRLGHPVNTVYNDAGGAVAATGKIYLSSDRPGGKGGADVYITRSPHNGHGALVNLGDVINTAADEHVVFVSADESYMIIYRFDKDDAVHSGLYLSYKDSQRGWRFTKSMGDHFTALNAIDATVSPDGDYLFFLSQGHGVYWMKTDIIEYLKDEDLEISKRLISTMHKGGLQAAVLTCRALQKQHAAYVDIDEYLLNQRGHQLLDVKQLADAIALFKIVVALFPTSWNAYDSLGEAYFAYGEMTQAKDCYERSLELNPSNENAVIMLERIRSILHH